MPTTKPRKNLRDIDRAIIQAVMFTQGILPMEKTNLDMKRALKQLPPDEARKLSRKFRKLWRQAMQVEVGTGSKTSYRSKAAELRYGVGKQVPSRAERQARKQLVFDRLWKEFIEPLVRNFENAGGHKNPLETSVT
jgi:hypothetical protein